MRTPSVLSSAALVVAISPAVGCSLDLTVSDCTAEYEEKLITVTRYMGAAARSNAFDVCVDGAVAGYVNLDTFQEHLWIGPYHPCDPAGADPRDDPSQFQADPSLGAAAIDLVSLNLNPLHLVCTYDRENTASHGSDHGYAHTQEELVYLGYAAQYEEPDHQTGWADSGPDFDYQHLAPSYPVDELASIILHEKLHTHGFEHGTELNECGFTAYECSETPAGTCRASSLPEIAEACMSEVVEMSVAWCSDTVCAAGETPINNNGSSSSPDCRCL